MCFQLRCHALNDYASCLQLHRRDIKAQTELTETDVACLSLHSGGIGASAGHRGERLDQRPGSLLNPITHLYRWKSCASASQGQRIKRFYIKPVISKAQEMQMFKMQIVFRINRLPSNALLCCYKGK